MATDPAATSHKAMPQCRRLQFSLRTLLVFVTLAAIVCSFIKWFGPRYFLRVFEIGLQCPFGELVIPVAFAVVCGASSWAFARRFAFHPRMSVAWILIGSLVFLNLAACGYLTWAHDRLTNHLLKINASASWLHPDRALLELDVYLEARYPPPPGTFRIHGMLPLIRFILDATIFFFSGCLGASGETVACQVSPREDAWTNQGDG